MTSQKFPLKSKILFYIVFGQEKFEEKTNQTSKEKKIFLVALPKRELCTIESENKNLIGYRVIVELEKKKDIGIVIKEISSGEKFKKAKNFEIVDEIPLIPHNLIKLCLEVSGRYFAHISDVIPLACPRKYFSLQVKLKKSKSEKNKKEKNENLEEIEKNSERKIGKSAERLIEILKNKKKITLHQAKEITKIEKIIELEKSGIIEIKPEKRIREKEEIIKEIKKQTNEEEIPEIILSDEQNVALQKIAEKNGVFLIHGATGSGKTEVYIRAIKETLKNKTEGEGAIYLLPEISITTFLISRIKKHFPNALVLHSGLKEKEREINWWSARYGYCDIIVGARSAIFAPFEKVKIIVVDEEHDHSYKQSPEGTNSCVFYDAREVAEIRAKIEGAKLIFGSATPSVERYFRAKNEEIELIEMKNRVPGMSFPKNKIIDLNKNNFDEFISFPLSYELKNEIEKRIERRENVILLFTRRGWAIYVMCIECGKKFQCRQCSRYLVYHKKEGLVCHWCGKTYPIPSTCPNCNSENLELIGFGTERIEEELKNLFKVPVFRMDSDNIKNERKAKEILEKFQKTNPAILVGTQMVTKGFDFPSVSLVGVILCDTEFMLPDFRADERTFQMIMQVSGRAGRRISTGNEISEHLSVIQTFSPEHPILQFAVQNDYKKFFEEEIEKRKEFLLPPFSRLVCIRFSGKDENKCWEVAEKFTEKIRENDIRCDGPSKSLRYLVSGKFNVKTIAYIFSEQEMKKLKEIFRISQFFYYGVKISVDVEPESTI
ncbi:Primosomal protein N' [bacterium HR19]|nr:Primosomal protein N' [bacterium HR19]